MSYNSVPGRITSIDSWGNDYTQKINKQKRDSDYPLIFFQAKVDEQGSQNIFIVEWGMDVPLSLIYFSTYHLWKFKEKRIQDGGIG